MNLTSELHTFFDGKIADTRVLGYYLRTTTLPGGGMLGLVRARSTEAMPPYSITANFFDTANDDFHAVELYGSSFAKRHVATQDG